MTDIGEPKGYLGYRTYLQGQMGKVFSWATFNGPQGKMEFIFLEAIAHNAGSLLPPGVESL